jgi:WD40 repeat protein
MGVTEITCLPWPHTLAVGSYDESLALWDLRALRQPSQTHALGGGVWRVKHVANSALPGASTVPTDALVLAIGCAANHFQLAGLTTGQLLPLAEHQHKALQATPQDTLAYGIDWCHSQPDLFASCSFYDKIYSVWQATSATGTATTQNG